MNGKRDQGGEKQNTMVSKNVSMVGGRAKWERTGQPGQGSPSRPIGVARVSTPGRLCLLGPLIIWQSESAW